MQVHRRTLEGQFAIAHPAQTGRQRRCIDVPHVGVADQREISIQHRLVGKQEGREVGAADFLLPLQHHRHRHRNSAAVRLPGAQRLQEHHHLSLVVDRPAGDDPGTMRSIHELRVEGGAVPKFQRVGGLHVVVAIEQDARRLRAGGPGMGGEHHRMTRRRPNLNRETKFGQLIAEPFGCLLNVRRVIRLRADAGDPQQIKKSFARVFEILIDPRQHRTNYVFR